MPQSPTVHRPDDRAELQALRALLRDWCRREAADEARNCLERGPQASLARWSDVAALGVLGAHVPAEPGAAGFGLSGAVEVLEELAYWLIPGPVLPTLLASELLLRFGDASTTELVADLATGSARAAVSWSGPRPLLEQTAGGVRVTGELGPVLGAPDADLLLVVASHGSAEVGVVVPVDSPGVAITGLAALDPTRSVGAVRLDGVTLAGGQLVPGLTSRAVAESAAVLLAAESAGIASWSLDTSVAHAKTRVQFGRPIGAFQAVNHHCVDLLVAREQTRSLAWQAARQADAGSRAVTAAAAAHVAPASAVAAAKTCIQVLGAVGFSWEHDAHLRLRRSAVNRQLAGAPAQWGRRIVELKDGAAAVTTSSGAAAQVLPGQVLEAVRRVAAAPHEARWRLLADSGLLAPALERPYGLAASPAEQLAIRDALEGAGVEVPDLVIGNWALATIATAGTVEQRERFIRPTLRGEIAWCQLFSEPEAGSDLASLRSTARRVTGGWRLHGHKIWTSRAAEADWAICLARARADSDAEPFGITFFLVPMHAEGVAVRPLRNAAGDLRFSEVLLADVFVTDDLVVGEVGDGWRVARTTLGSERVQMSRTRFGTSPDVVLRMLADLGPGSRRDREAEVGDLMAQALTLEAMATREADGIGAGAVRHGSAEVRKLLTMEHYQRSSDLALQLLGPAGTAPGDGVAGQVVHDFLETRGLTIGGGTTEVLKTAVGERVLGLPRGRDRA